MNLKTIGDWVNSNWLTTLKYCRKLKDIGAVNLIEVEGRVVGVKLNTEAYNLIDEAFWEAEKKEPSLFKDWIKEKRVIILKGKGAEEE